MANMYNFSLVLLVVIAMCAVGSTALRPRSSCRGKTNRELTLATRTELVEIIQLITKIDFKSAALSLFTDVAHSIGSVVGGIFSSTKTVNTRTLATFQGYSLNGKLIGDNADFRIQSSSKTYSNVVMKVGKVFGVTTIRDAFVESCTCGQTVYLQ